MPTEVGGRNGGVPPAILELAEHYTGAPPKVTPENAVPLCHPFVSTGIGLAGPLVIAPAGRFGPDSPVDDGESFPIVGHGSRRRKLASIEEFTADQVGEDELVFRAAHEAILESGGFASIVTPG